MEAQKDSKPVEQIVAAIQSMDLEPIKFKLMDAEEGEGWSKEMVDRLEVEYKRFLMLLVKYPDAVIAPSKDVDAFWHGHILDTMKYAEDCEQVFGYFLHHFPYFGMRGEADAAALADASKVMRELTAKEFGASTPAEAAFCYAAKPANAAFCYAAKPASAAFCYAAKPVAGKAAAAFCYASKPASAAFCYAAKPASAAFCYAAKPVAEKAETAFCYAAKPANAAFCYAAKPASAAFCYAAKPVAGKAVAAFCYAAKPAGSKAENFDYSRPRLALAA